MSLNKVQFLKGSLKKISTELAVRFLFPVVSPVFEQTVTILLYHDIDPILFEQHVSYLEKKYNIITLRQYAQYLTESDGVDLPSKALIITMDDGWKRNYRLLHTIKSKNIPVTIFLCSELIGTNRKIWNYSLDRTGIHRQFNERLKNLPVENKNKELLEFNGHFPEKEYSERSFLNNEEIIEMSSFVDFQSHGTFHEVLKNCTDAQILNDVTKSAINLKTRLGLDIYAFAYPYGRNDLRCIDAVKKAGYAVARTSNRPGLNSSGCCRFELKSIGIPDNAKLSNLKSIEAWAKIRFLLERLKLSFYK